NYISPVIVFISFAMVFWMVRTGPVFHDEIHWQLQNAHLNYDGYKLVNLYAVCVSNFTWPVPLLLLPGRIFASLFHPENLMQLRILGMVKYLVCIGLFSLFAYKVLEKKYRFIMVLAVIIAVLSIGFLPTLLIYARPESSILIGVLFILLLFI